MISEPIITGAVKERSGWIWKKKEKVLRRSGRQNRTVERTVKVPIGSVKWFPGKY